MKIIVAVDKKWGIGKNNNLLFKIPADMKFFREQTTQKVVVMGSNTLKSFPNEKPLPNRTNIVLSTTLNRDDCIIVKSLDELSTVLQNYDTDDVYIIGGAKFYKTMLPFAEELFVTKVDADGDADVFFDNLDENKNFECVNVSEPVETNSYIVRFTKYINRNVKSF